MGLGGIFHLWINWMACTKIPYKWSKYSFWTMNHVKLLEKKQKHVAVWFGLLFYLQTHKEADTQGKNKNLVFGNVSFSFLSIK